MHPQNIFKETLHMQAMAWSKHQTTTKPEWSRAKRSSTPWERPECRRKNKQKIAGMKTLVAYSSEKCSAAHLANVLGCSGLFSAMAPVEERGSVMPCLAGTGA